ncbi:MAG: hypothetical protein LUE98_20620 [Tannerellaceae bacterium]|nr:hypothetical protein [Tannerellaceae bacterium]
MKNLLRLGITICLCLCVFTAFANPKGSNTLYYELSMDGEDILSPVNRAMDL